VIASLLEALHKSSRSGPDGRKSSTKMIISVATRPSSNTFATQYNNGSYSNDPGSLVGGYPVGDYHQSMVTMVILNFMEKRVHVHTIGGIFTTQDLYIEQGGYMPFEVGIGSDHQCLWLDISTRVLMGKDLEQPRKFAA
jgi:hypothetical protein